MFFTPHKLYKKVKEETRRDKYNRLLPSEEYWSYVCDCRCDDNSDYEFRSEEGTFYRPQYHIVCPRNANIKSSDDIRVTNGEELRGEGKVYNVKHLNFLDYSDVWV